MASYFGNHIHISIFGQSHSEAIGVTVDGFPPGRPWTWSSSRRFSAAGLPAGTPPPPLERKGTFPGSCAAWWKG